MHACVPPLRPHLALRAHATPPVCDAPLPAQAASAAAAAAAAAASLVTEASSYQQQAAAATATAAASAAAAAAAIQAKKATEEEVAALQVETNTSHPLFTPLPAVCIDLDAFPIPVRREITTCRLGRLPVVF
jgi:hypothetical protein